MTDEEAARAAAVESGVGWSQLDGRARWEELILPTVSRDLLRSIAGDLRFRRSPEGGAAGRRRAGLKLMFAGEPGTGKRLAARMLATDLGLPILSVDLAGVVSRKRAESEERLDHLFATADRLQAIVYFADAGTWFAERTSAASRPAGDADPDLMSLLGRIDSYRGVVIFAATLGIAYGPVIERLDHVVEFPFPDEVARARIWPLLLPRASHLGERELEFLATSFPLTGGAIKRSVAAAVSAAATEGSPAELRHFVAAIEGEYGDRLHSVRARQALARFYADTWETASATAAAPAARRVAAAPAPAARAPVGRAMALPPARRRGLLRALVLVAVAVAALIGFLIAHSPRASIARTPSLATHLASGPLGISVPSVWRRATAPAGPNLGLRDEIVYGPTASDGGTLVIGIDPAAGTTLPAALADALPSTPTPEVVTLDGTRFYRYLGLAPRGASGVEALYLVPSTAGTVIAQCIVRGTPTSFPTTCERVVGSMRLSWARAPGHPEPDLCRGLRCRDHQARRDGRSHDAQPAGGEDGPRPGGRGDGARRRLPRGRDRIGALHAGARRPRARPSPPP